jgi:hypothetical protein
VYYTAEVGAVAKGITFSIKVDYRKEGEALSSESLEIQPSAPLSKETPGRMDLMQILPWVLGVLGVLLIAGGSWWYWQSGREKGAAQIRRRRKASAIPKAESAIQGGVYCHQCGKRAEAGDRFCRSCGTRLREEGG